MSAGGDKFHLEELAEAFGRKLRPAGLMGWEIYLLGEEGLSVESRSQKLESMESESLVSLALRVIDKGRPGFGYSCDFRPEQIERLTSEVLSRARQSDFDPDQTLPEPGEKTGPLPGIYDQSFGRKSEREKIERAAAMEKSALDADSRIKRVRACEYQETMKEVLIVNSSGLKRKTVSTSCSASISAVAEEGRDAQIASEFDWSFRYDMLNVEMAGKNVAAKAVAKLGARQVSSRKAPVIFVSEVAGEFLELLSYAVNGESLAKGKTWLKGMTGKKVFSQTLTVIDDGLFSRGPECFPFDGEGVAAKKKFVVRDGVLKKFIFDSYYASKLAKRSTGNARRDQVAVPPTVGPTNFYVPAGRQSFEQLLGAMDSGLVVEEVLGMHMADEITGEYSVGVSGHLVRKGRLDEPVRGVAIAGNLKDLFARVSDKACDLKFYHNCASPSLLIEELEISGS